MSLTAQCCLPVLSLSLSLSVTLIKVTYHLQMSWETSNSEPNDSEYTSHKHWIDVRWTQAVIYAVNCKTAAGVVSSFVIPQHDIKWCTDEHLADIKWWTDENLAHQTSFSIPWFDAFNERSILYDNCHTWQLYRHGLREVFDCAANCRSTINSACRSLWHNNLTY